MNLESNFFLISDSIFKSNKGISGGVLFILESINNSKIINCEFIDNTAATSGGSIMLENSNPLLINNIFINNSAAIGGAIRYTIKKMNS